MGFFKRDRPVSTVEPAAGVPIRSSSAVASVNGTSPSLTATTAAAAQPMVVDAKPFKDKRGLFGSKKPSRNNTHHATDNTSAIIAPVSPSRTSRDRGARNTTLASPINAIGNGTNLHTARERVRAAEVAERAAVQALEVARTQLLEAKRHVEALEVEAKQQAHAAEQAARDASAMLAEATEMKRRTTKLGHHS